ncbi:hypothetical protein [Streptomyces oceani]|uniref:DNA primase n=1 Tax=Streptomyces oceani TaxID=1075402 RepID=A0A1E7KPF6_9ACTN|nr:hypothetical protein [Streptomyces oceani]OEV05776.1 hypothetical protein AN216_02225 [Streptomyces oceani]
MTNHTARIGGALVGGYLLGRTRKARMALGLGMFLAGRKLSMNPQRLGRMAANSPALSGLSDQACKEVVDATKSAATSALTKRAEGLAETLHQRTLDLGGTPGESDEDAEEPGDTDAEADTREDTAKSADDEGGAKRSAPRRRAPAGRKTSSGRTGSGKSGSGKPGSEKTSRAASAKRTSDGASTTRAASTGTTKSATKNATKSVQAASGGRRSSARGGDHG